VNDAYVAAELRREQAVVDALYARLDAVREQTALALAGTRRGVTAGTPAARVERDAFLALQSEQLRRFDAVEERLCIGRIDGADGAHAHIGRVGLTDPSGRRLLIDWRAPAAQPFYRATAARPDGIISRRHISTVGRTVTGVSDEVLDLDAFTAAGGDTATVSQDGALLLSLNANRTGRMRDIVATIQAEQDEIIRAPLAGVLVVQGGPGTGKTVVALHRAAYLLYAHRDRLARSGVLVIGPNARFLRYIEQVLPSLGETGVVLAAAGQLYPGVDATADELPEVVAVKGDLRMVDVLAAAVKARQRAPRRPVRLNVEGTWIELAPRDVEQARHRAQLSRKPHNVARRRFVAEILDRLAARLAKAQNLDLDDDTRGELVNALRGAPDVRREVNLCWMPLLPEKLLRDLYARPDLLDRAGRRLSRAERDLLRRDRTAPWTAADVALLDEAAELLGPLADGDADTAAAAAAEDRKREIAYAETVFDLAPDAAEMTTAAALADRYGSAAVRRALAEDAAHDRGWAFGHIVVDEAQELSAMQWRVLMRRCPSRSMTLVGDTAQTGSAAGAASWAQMLDEHVTDRWRLAELTVNYRTPGRIMDPAVELLLASGVRASPMTSAREGDWAIATTETQPAQLASVTASSADEEARRLDGGQVAIIAPSGLIEAIEAELAQAGSGERVSVLTPRQSKGLEFDSVILTEPDAIVAGSARGASDLYVAMTRCTQRLQIVRTRR